MKEWHGLTLKFLLETDKVKLALWLVANADMSPFAATMEAIKLKADAGVEWYAQGQPLL